MSETTTIEGIREEIAALETQIKDKKAELRALRGLTGKAKAEPKPCGCGCGDLTRGGEFLPGHDARFRGRLLKAIDAGDESAIAALLARPTLLHGATETELRERLGSEQRREQAKAERAEQRKADAKARKTNPKAKTKRTTARVDKTEVQQGTRSPSVTRNGAAIRNAQQRTDYGAPRSEGIDAAL